jgi:hypothetical protein
MAMAGAGKKLRILTWHLHGNYLYYLTKANHNFYVPFTAERGHPYGGRGTTFAFGDNVHEVPAATVRDLDFDVILFQARANYEQHQYDILSPEQRRLPRVFLEHDPPREHPTDTVHAVTDPSVTVVHVTNFNRLMWDNGSAPTRVIEHGVAIPEGVTYKGDIARGLVAINDLATRGRRLGLDVFERLQLEIPLDLVGMGSERLGGLGEVPPMELPEFASHYRFLLNPIRYTSLGLAVCEALSIGLPVLGLATSEMPSVIQNGVNGYLETDPGRLVGHAQRLLDCPAEAQRLGANASEAAARRFGIDRFISDWDATFKEVTAMKTATIGATR